MDVSNIIAELRTERDQLTLAIETLERIAFGQGKRRGRPPKWMSQQAGSGRTAPATAPEKTSRFSPETRRKMAAAQKKRWAERNAAK